MDHESDKIERLEDRIEQLEAVTKKMMPSRRDALKLGGAAAIGAATMSGTASAGSNQVGTIGDANNLVDIEAEDVSVSDTITTQDIVVNGTATGPFGGGGIVLESGDTITVETVGPTSNSNDPFFTLYSGTAKDVLGGVVAAEYANNWYYEFSDGNIINKSGTGKTNTPDYDNRSVDEGGDNLEIDFLPPAKDVVEIGVGSFFGFGNYQMGAEVILKD